MYMNNLLHRAVLTSIMKSVSSAATVYTTQLTKVCSILYTECNKGLLVQLSFQQNSVVRTKQSHQYGDPKINALYSNERTPLELQQETTKMIHE